MFRLRALLSRHSDRGRTFQCARFDRRSAIKAFSCGLVSYLGLALAAVGGGLTSGCERAFDEPGHAIAVASQGIASGVQSAFGSPAVVASQSVSATFLIAPVQSDLLVAVLANPAANSSVNVPTGWNLVTGGNQLNASPGQAIYYKSAGASEPQTVTFGGLNSSLLHALQIFEFSGADGTVTPAVGTATTTTGTSYTFSPVTTASAGAVVVLAAVATNSALPRINSWGANGFSQVADFSVGSDSYSSAYLIAGAAGAYNTTTTLGLSAKVLGQAVAFNRRPTPITDLTVSVAAGVTQAVIRFTAASTPLSHVLILANTIASASSCSFTTDPVGTEAKGTTVGSAVVLFNDSPTSNLSSTNVTLGGTTTVAYVTSTGTLTHASLTPGTKYCYKAYARNGTALDDNSGSGRPVRFITPTMATSTNPLFVVGSGGTSLSAPSILSNTGAFYADNTGKVMSVGTAGARLFAPYVLPDAVQNRGAVGTLTGDTDATLFVSSVSGDAYAVWASGTNTGTQRWSTFSTDWDSTTSLRQPLGDALYAAPLVSNTLGRVFVGTRNTALKQNRVFGLNAKTGACVWVLNGTCAGGTTATVNLGQISSVPILDPTNYRLIFTSTSFALGSSVWALDAHDAPTTRVLWSRNIGDSDSSIAFTSSARTSMLVGTNAGVVFLLDPSTGSTCWGSGGDGCGVASGLEEAFCTGTNTRASILCLGGSAILQGIVTLNGSYAGKFLFSTADGSVRLVNGAGVQQWRTVVAGASAPLAVVSVGSGYVYVGGNDGAVHELALATGTQTATRAIGVGPSAGSIVVGDPGYDGTASVLYVNTAQGNQYGFSVPF